MQHKPLSLSVARKTLLCSLLFAAVVVHVFSWSNLGIQTALSTSLLSATFVFLFHSLGRKIHPSSYVLLCLAQALSLGVAFRLSEALQVFTFITIMLLFAAAGVQQIRPLMMGIKDFVLYTLLLPFMGLAMIGGTFYQAKINRSQKLTERQMALLRGVLVAVPILIVFGLLFASADAVFKDVFGDIVGLDGVIEWLFSPKQFLLAFIFLAIGGMLSYVLAARTAGPQKAVQRQRYGVELAVVLALLNVLFAVFVVIQAVYLFGGRDFVLNGDLTYADYGRRGFFELVWVAVGVYALGYFAHAHNVQSGSKRTRYLLYGLMGQVGIVIISALRRLSLYESAYGLSELRVYAHIFVLVIVASFALLIVALLRRWNSGHLTYGLVVLAASYMLLVNVINIPAIIAHSNTSRRNESGVTDLNYIMRLPADASAQQARVIRQMPPSDEKNRLVSRVCMYATSITDASWSQHWSTYHFGRKQAIKDYESIGCNK